MLQNARRSARNILFPENLDLRKDIFSKSKLGLKTLFFKT